MSKAGVWIDRSHAVVVMVSGAETTVKSFSTENSNSSSDGIQKPTYTPNDFIAEDKLERKHAIDRAHMYDAVLEHIGKADSLYVLGPGEAKQEFNHRFAAKHPQHVDITIESSAKMTDPQLCAKVREHFSKQ